MAFAKPFINPFLLLIIMSRYRKGANAERELLQLLHKEGFAVVRVAGSGATALPCPDCLALTKRKKFAFECKAWKGKYLSIAREQMQSLLLWSKQAGIPVYIAWKVPREGWLFIKPKDFKKSEKAYSIKLKDALRAGATLNVLIGKQKQLKVK